MKSIFYFVSLVVCCLSPRFGDCQRNTTVIDLQKKIIEQSLSVNDFTTASFALHHIIALEGERSPWQDTLLMVYFRAKNYASSYLLATQLLQNRKNDLKLLQINAASLVNLGALREAIEVYESLYTQTKQAENGYELANLQYRLKRLAEAENTLKNLLQNNLSSELKVSFQTPTGDNQLVPLKAAALNMRGMIAYDLKQNEQAASYFKQALEITPDFLVAKQNSLALSAMKSKATENGTDAEKH